MINDVLNTAELLQINISNYELDLVQEKSSLQTSNKDRAGREYVEDVDHRVPIKIECETSMSVDETYDAVIMNVINNPSEEKEEGKKKKRGEKRGKRGGVKTEEKEEGGEEEEDGEKEEGELIEDENVKTDPAEDGECPATTSTTIAFDSSANHKEEDSTMDFEFNDADFIARNSVIDMVLRKELFRKKSDQSVTLAERKLLFWKKINLKMRNVLSKFKERTITKEDNLILQREMVNIKSKLLKRWDNLKKIPPAEPEKLLSEAKLIKMLNDAYKNAKSKCPTSATSGTSTGSVFESSTTATPASQAFVEKPQPNPNPKFIYHRHVCQCGSEFTSNEKLIIHRWYTHYFDLYHKRTKLTVQCSICPKEIRYV